MKRWRTIHRWLGVVVGIQVLFWISGGLIMSAIPIDLVRGIHLIDRQAKSEGSSASALTPALQRAIDSLEWQSLEWARRGSNLALGVTDTQGERKWLDPESGAVLSDISTAQASVLAQMQYLGDGKVAQVVPLTVIPQEVRRLSLPLIRVDFDDWINTSFYVDPQSAKVISVRSDIWRLFDLFWMLHIMDYDSRTDFNNPLLIAFALLSLCFTTSGLLLLYKTLIKPKTIRGIRKLGVVKGGLT